MDQFQLLYQLAYRARSRFSIGNPDVRGALSGENQIIGIHRYHHAPLLRGKGKLFVIRRPAPTCILYDKNIHASPS